eukprot:scaffold57705_cov36-Phaeocystis_antarctica.AAC.1
MDDGAAAMPRVSANSLKMSAGSALTARAISLSTSPSATCPANSGTSGRKAEPTMPREVPPRRSSRRRSRPPPRRPRRCPSC